MSTKTLQTLRVEHTQQHVMTVTFNRPQAANALNTQMGREIHGIFFELLLDPGDIRCVVLTGAGDKAFCAGGDLKERHGMSDDDWLRQHVIFEQALCAIMDCPVAVIAAVNGAAYGGGCELALACDFIYADAGVRFALTETSLGIIPGGGGTQNLARAVGARRAKELIFSAAPFTAEDGFRWGLVNRVTASREVLREAQTSAVHIAGNAPVAVRQAKRAIVIGAESDLKTGLAVEIEAYSRTVSTLDRREGVAAFNERRPPNFTGH